MRMLRLRTRNSVWVRHSTAKYRYVCNIIRFIRPRSRPCRVGLSLLMAALFICQPLIILSRQVIITSSPHDTYCRGPDLRSIVEERIKYKHPTNLTEIFYRKQPTKICPFRFDAVIRPKTVCDEDTFMVILTHSYHQYADKRHAIRRTWGGAAVGKVEWPGQNISKKIKMMFVLGQHRLPSMNQLVKDESEKYGDILVGNFTDAYFNMTYKSLFGLKYVSEHCRSARYLLKTDDDMVLNMPYLIEMLDRNPLTRSIWGNQLHRKVKRRGKWALTLRQFPFDEFPTYDAGGAYVISSDIVRELYETAEYVPQFSVDDVYVTGVLAKIIGAKHVTESRLFWGDRTWGNIKIKPCEILTNRRLMQTQMSPSKLLSFWDQMKSTKCIV